MSTKRLCPVCTSGSEDQVIKIEFELFSGHPMNGGYNVVQCKDCGFVFADTTITQEQLDVYYTELSKYEDKTIGTGGGFTQSDKNRLSDAAKFIAKSIEDKSLRVLDLGCSNGGLLRELRDEGFTNLVGIDPSYACVEITKMEAGCPAYQHSLFDIPESAGKFDVIILSHVMEHILNVRDCVEVLNGLLNDGGIVYLECPNAEHYKDVIHAPLQEFNAEHINHFTETAFRNLMGLNGYKTLMTADKIFQIASDQDYHAVYGLFKKENLQNYMVQFDTTVRPALQEYIDKSNVILDGIKKELASLPNDKPVALLGIGQFAFKLLRTDAFKNSIGIKLFDNNKMVVGKEVKGIKILPGSEIYNEYKKEPFSIVVSSLIHEVAIRKGITEVFKANKEEPPVMVGFSHLL